MIVRKIGSTLTLDVKRVHPAPGRARLVWMAISFMTTERPWVTDGGTLTAYKKKDGHLKELGRAVVTRGAAFVRLPWKKKAPVGRSSVMVCYLGSDVVEESCSPYVVVPPRRLAASRTSPAPPPRKRPGPARPRRPGSRRAAGRSAAGRRGCTAPPARGRPARRR